MHAVIWWNKDPVFEEISKIFDEVYKEKGYAGTFKTHKFNMLFGRLCDPAPDGSLYDMSGDVHCPECQSEDVSWGPTNPPVSLELDLPEGNPQKMGWAQSRTETENS